MNNKRTIIKLFSGVMILTFAIKVLGFVRDVVLSYFYGATGISDAYFISQTIPGNIFQFVSAGLTTCFIPIYFIIIKDKSKKDGDNFTNSILSLVLSFSSIVIIFVWLFTPFFIKLFASGFSGDTLKYAIIFTRIGILTLIFSSFIYVFNTYLQANRKFIIISVAGIINTLFIIFSIIVASKTDVIFISIGSSLAVVIQLLVLLKPIKQLNLKYRFRINFNDKYVKRFFMLFLPTIIGVGVNEINTLIDKSIASQLSTGAISALTYSNSLIMFAQGGIVLTIATLIYPKISEKISKGDKKNARIILEKIINVTYTILIPISIAFIIYGTEIITLIFGRGKFDIDAINMTSLSLKLYSVGLVFYGIRELLSRYYYANYDTKTPVINSAIGVIINIILNIILTRCIGIGGLTLATSISAIITTCLLYINTRKIDKSEKILISLKEIIKVLLISIVAIGLSYIIYLQLSFSVFISSLIAFVISVVLLITLSKIFKLKTFVYLKELK